MPEPRFYSFWSINARLDLERLCRQLDDFAASGLDGVVFHPRYYPDDPEYLGDDFLAIVSQTILYARSIGMRFWIYDENGWPSGTVGGRLVEQYPDDVQLWVGLTLLRPAEVLAQFDRDGQTWYFGLNRGPGVDYLGTTLAPHFLDMTYERYRLGLSPEAFEHVEAFFDDEPEFGLGHAYDQLPQEGALPWTSALPDLYRARHGHDLLDLLPSIFFDDERSAVVRVAFWELVTDLFSENFIGAMSRWSVAHGKRFASHTKGEEHPLFQVPMIGSSSQVYARLSLPGIDALERFPGNDFYPRQGSTAARQWGDGRAMVEAWGGSGWGGTPEDLERYLLWLGRHGLTDFVMHLSQYRLDSPALDDWPPSQPRHLTWSRAYADVIGRVRDELRAQPRPPASLLVVAPYRAIMAQFSPRELVTTNVHNANTHPDSPAARLNAGFMALITELHGAGVDYDVVDERTLEDSGVPTESGISIGASEYAAVLVDTACILSPDARSLVSRLDHPSPGRSTAPDLPRSIESEAVAVDWSLVRSPLNSVVVECESLGNGWFSGALSVAGFAKEVRLTVVFADTLDALEVDGVWVDAERTEEGSRAVLSACDGPVRFRFCIAGLRTTPRVWAEGMFAVDSTEPFGEGPRSTVRTAGEFRVVPPRRNVEGELVAGGYPFLREPLVLRATADLRGGSRLRVSGLQADAIGVTIDGRWHGWSWPHDGDWTVEAPIEGGSHDLQIELIPNGFNYYGPHHYYGGDWFVISPDQIAGRRNFADPVDAPPQTLVDAWYFRPMRAPTSVSVQESRPTLWR